MEQSSKVTALELPNNDIGELSELTRFFLSFQETGLRELEIGYQQTDSIRRVLCAMVLLGYHLIVTYILGNGEGNLLQCHSILEDQLRVSCSSLVTERWPPW